MTAGQGVDDATHTAATEGYVESRRLCVLIVIHSTNGEPQVLTSRTRLSLRKLSGDCRATIGNRRATRDDHPEGRCFESMKRYATTLA